MYREAGEHLLLPDGDERAVRDAGDARGRARGHPQGHVSPQAGGEAEREAAARSCSAAARSSTKWSRRRRSCRSTASPPMCGASPATRSSIARRTPASAGTCCIRASRRACRTSRSALRTRRACSSRRPTISRSCPTRSTAGCRGRSVRSGPTASGAARIAQSLRDFFEVDARFVALATLSELLKEGQVEASLVQQAIKDLGINQDKPIRRPESTART